MAETGSKSETKQKMESKPIVENKPVEEAPKKSKKLLILIGAAVLILAGGGAAFMTLPFFKGMRGAHAGKAKPVVEKEEVKATLALEPFLLNLADTDEVRFVKATFQLGLAKQPDEEIKSGATIPSIRDAIISVLTSKRAEQVLSPEGKELLRNEIRTKINAISPSAKVLEVYIVDFVVQL
jgi:flagellar FliL protein